MQLGYGLAHVMQCDKDEAECSVCQELKTEHMCWPPARMFTRDLWEEPGIQMAQNFDVARVAHEFEEASIASGKRTHVREMLRKYRERSHS